MPHPTSKLEDHPLSEPNTDETHTNQNQQQSHKVTVLNKSSEDVSEYK
jgi:hypothetical protein